jgi:hypothetical protein
MALTSLALRTRGAGPRLMWLMAILGIFGAGAVLRRRGDHAGDVGAVGGRRPRGRHTRCSSPTWCLSPSASAPSSASAAGHGERRCAVRPDHDVLVRHPRRARHLEHPAPPRCDRRHQPLVRRPLLSRNIGAMPIWRWAPWCWRSPAARRCMPTWGTSVAAHQVGLAGLRFPCLYLNYLGQGALILDDPEAVKNPFFLLVP